MEFGLLRFNPLRPRATARIITCWEFLVGYEPQFKKQVSGTFYCASARSPSRISHLASGIFVRLGVRTDFVIDGPRSARVTRPTVLLMHRHPH